MRKKQRKTVSMDAQRKRASIPGSSNPAGPECSLTELPHGLIVDILSRLPIKSLFNCKFVCKPWLQLISDPHFVKLHLSRASIAILIEVGHPGSGELLSAQLVEEVDNKTLHVEKMRFVPNTSLPDTAFHVINSCNGLICLYGKSEGKFNQKIYVCNPILGEYLVIPVVKNDRKCRQYFALGSSSVSNQCKVLQTFFLDREHVTQRWAEIYTVGTGQWRSIGNAPFCLNHLDAIVFLHDSVHWIDFYTKSDGFIYAFDFGFEQFKRLSLPPDSQILVGSDMHSISRVGVLKACLFAAFDDGSECGGDMEIWVMEEYGVKESWSKKFVVNLQLDDYISCKELGDFVSLRPLCSLGLLCCLGSGKTLIFEVDDCIVCCDVKSKSIQDIGISHGMNIIDVTTYSPSFVSLKDIAKGEELKVLRC